MTVFEVIHKEINTKQDLLLSKLSSGSIKDHAEYNYVCGNIIKTEETIKNEEILATVLFVVKLGTDCYKDESRFPSGPYCKEGDFVLVRPHTGTKINIHGKAFRLINDDSIEAVVDDPRGIQRQ